MTETNRPGEPGDDANPAATPPDADAVPGPTSDEAAADAPIPSAPPETMTAMPEIVPSEVPLTEPVPPAPAVAEPPAPPPPSPAPSPAPAAVIPAPVPPAALPPAPAPRGRSWAGTVSRIIAFLFGVLQALLIVRIVLLLLNANPDNEIVDWVMTVTEPFVAPFRGIFEQDEVTGAQGSVLDIAAIVALIAWTLVETLIVSLLGLFRRRQRR